MIFNVKINLGQNITLFVVKFIVFSLYDKYNIKIG